MTIPTIGPEGGAGNSGARPRHTQSKGTIIAVIGLVGLAVLGIIETVVLITLAATGQIG